MSHLIPVAEEVSLDYAAEVGEFVEITMVNEGLKIIVYAVSEWNLYCFNFKNGRVLTVNYT